MPMNLRSRLFHSNKKREAVPGIFTKRVSSGPSEKEAKECTATTGGTKLYTCTINTDQRRSATTPSTAASSTNCSTGTGTGSIVDCALTSGCDSRAADINMTEVGEVNKPVNNPMPSSARPQVQVHNDTNKESSLKVPLSSSSSSSSATSTTNKSDNPNNPHIGASALQSRQLESSQDQMKSTNETTRTTNKNEDNSPSSPCGSKNSSVSAITFDSHPPSVTDNEQNMNWEKRMPNILPELPLSPPLTERSYTHNVNDPANATTTTTLPSQSRTIRRSILPDSSIPQTMQQQQQQQQQNQQQNQQHQQPSSQYSDFDMKHLRLDKIHARIQQLQAERRQLKATNVQLLSQLKENQPHDYSHDHHNGHHHHHHHDKNVSGMEYPVNQSMGKSKPNSITSNNITNGNNGNNGGVVGQPSISSDAFASDVSGLTSYHLSYHPPNHSTTSTTTSYTQSHHSNHTPHDDHDTYNEHHDQQNQYEEEIQLLHEQINKLQTEKEDSNNLLQLQKQQHEQTKSQLSSLQIQSTQDQTLISKYKQQVTNKNHFISNLQEQVLSLKEDMEDLKALHSLEEEELRREYGELKVETCKLLDYIKNELDCYQGSPLGKGRNGGVVHEEEGGETRDKYMSLEEEQQKQVEYEEYEEKERELNQEHESQRKNWMQTKMDIEQKITSLSSYQSLQQQELLVSPISYKGEQKSQTQMQQTPPPPSIVTATFDDMDDISSCMSHQSLSQTSEISF